MGLKKLSRLDTRRAVVTSRVQILAVRADEVFGRSKELCVSVPLLIIELNVATMKLNPIFEKDGESSFFTGKKIFFL